MPKSIGSAQALAKKDIPTGSPCTMPAGTVIWGYPATALAVEYPPV
jgi:hypothetical protein